MELETFEKPASVPPLLPLVPQGSLYYVDGSSPNGSKINFDIHGVIDKGFFFADNQWTCYRRNYFSCICSFTLSPLAHSWHSSQPPIQFVRESDGATYHVSGGFAMSISAVVAENDQQTIELVQHTPKRDKGPTSTPEKTRLSPKPLPHPHMVVFSQPDETNDPRAGYDFTQPQAGAVATEHTFERIQFKSATANNGKRRAAQQFYHLVIELWADVGAQTGTQSPWIKVGSKKSARMIVRGRSPGHYQNERRRSASSGPGGAAGSIGFSAIGQDFNSTAPNILPSNFGHPGYDPRSTNQYSSSTRHSQEVGVDTMMAEEHKPMHESKDYHYYPATIYESGHNVEMFQHSTRERQVGNSAHTLPSPSDHQSKVKPEYDGSRAIYQQGPQWNRSGQCGRYEGKHTSNGFYPTVAPSGLNIT